MRGISLWLFFGVALGIVIGLAFPRRPAIRTLTEAIRRLAPQSQQVDFGILNDTWNLIENRYVNRPVNPHELLRGALEGMAQSLGDPYSFYLNPSESSAFEEEINGKFEGIGMELGLREKSIVVIAPLPNSPAERAGIRAGDTITKIDGSSTEGMTLEEAVLKIRGKEGTSVALTFVRDGEEQTQSIERKKIQVQSVKLDFRELPNDKTVALVQISSFTQTTKTEFDQAVRSILVRQPAGIVLDVRNNPGGYLDAAVAVADAFLQDGPIVIEDFGRGNRTMMSADRDAPLAPFRPVVLVNGGSASAAEILAGALQDRVNAPVVGEKTFGKGSVQEIEQLSDGSTLKITVAHWLTPLGLSIEQKGIEPSILVPHETQTSADGSDAQLRRALDEFSS